MKILVLGATGATGRLVTSQALDGGIDVRALVRSPEKLPMRDPRLEVVTGQATSADDVAAAMAGVDAVISTLGASTGTVISDAVEAITKAAHHHAATRVVVLTSFTVLRDRLTTPLKLISSLAMRELVKDQSAAVDMLAASDLDWTVVHAVRLTDGPASGEVTELSGDSKVGMGRTIARADVATHLLSAALGETGSTSTSRRAVVIST